MLEIAKKRRSEEDVLQYMPPPDISKEFTREFNRLVPMSPNGVDRLLRFAWGCSRKEYVAGVNVCRYGDTDNDPPKYKGRCRWILEGWQSPDIYDREEWRACGQLLGEYPATGYWDFLAYLEDDDQGFVSLEDGRAIQMVKSWLWWQGEGKKRSVEHLMEQRVLRRQLQDQRAREAADARAEQFGEDVVREFEKAKNTPNAFSDQVKKTFGGAYETTASGLLVPRN